jgi:hypothetical protein
MEIVLQNVQPPEIVGGFLIINECERCHKDFPYLTLCDSCTKLLCDECFTQHLRENPICACEAAN